MGDSGSTVPHMSGVRPPDVPPWLNVQAAVSGALIVAGRTRCWRGLESRRHTLPVTSPAQAAPAPTLTAAGAILIDSTTGATLMSKSPDTKCQMASTSKIMTAVVVTSLPGVYLEQKVTVKQEYLDYVYLKGASSAQLNAGSTPTVRQLLYAMMLPFGCDAAYALADTFGRGTTTSARTTDFIAQMNAKA